jgi:hypothetical protein
MYELEVGRSVYLMCCMALTRGQSNSKERNVGVRLLNPFPIIPKAQLIEANISR